MGLYLRNNRYYYKKQIEGKVYYQSLRIRKGQENLLSDRLRQVEDEIISRHFGLTYKPRQDISFDEYVLIYKDNKKHKKSLAQDSLRLSIISKALNNPQLVNINNIYIKRLEKHLIEKREVGHTTVNRYFGLLKHFLNQAIRDGYLHSNPLDGYEFFIEDETRRSLSFEELKKILGAAKQIQSGARSPVYKIIYDIIVFALNTGLRLSEILNLKKCYIYNEYISIPITETKYRRRSVSRVQKSKIIYLNNISLYIYNKYRSDNEYVFPLDSRNSNVIRKAIFKIRELTGITDFTFHQLRHTVSTLISSQTDLATAKVVLGHSDMKTTLKYTHPEREQQRKAVAKIETYFKALSADI